MFFKTLCFLAPCLAMAVAATSSSSSAMMPTVTIFYQNSDMACAKFFGDFYKTFTSSNLNESMAVKLNPYGNATVSPNKLPNGTYAFNCEHGYNACQKNMMQGCVIRNEPNNAVVLKYVNCSLSDYTSQNLNDECAQVAGVNVTALHACMNSTAGNLYYYDFGAEYSSMAIDSVPSVAFNNTFNKTVSAAAISDFSNAFCNFVKASNMSNDYCKSKDNAATVPSVSIFTLVIASILLVKMYQ